MTKDYLPSSEGLDQQQGGMSKHEFAALHGLTCNQIDYALRTGKVLGASRHPLSKHWRIYPPAKLLFDPSELRGRKLKDSLTEEAKVLASPQASVCTSALANGSSLQALAGAGQHPRRPRTPSEVQGTDPLSEDGFTLGDLAHRSELAQLGKLPDVFACRKVKEAVRVIGLAGREIFYPLVLSGAQMLAIERALLHDAEAIKQRLDFVDEFEPEARVFTGEQLATVYAALRTVKQAATAKNRQHAAQQNPGVQL